MVEISTDGCIRTWRPERPSVVELLRPTFRHSREVARQVEDDIKGMGYNTSLHSSGARLIQIFEGGRVLVSVPLSSPLRLVRNEGIEAREGGTPYLGILWIDSKRMHSNPDFNWTLSIVNPNAADRMLALKDALSKKYKVVIRLEGEDL